MKKPTASKKSFFITAIIVYSIALLFYGYLDFTNRQKDIIANIDAELYNSAVALKYILPDDFHDRAVDNQSISIKEDRYIAHKLTKLIKETGLKYSYTIIKQGQKLFFIASDITANPKTKRGTFYFFPYDEADASFINAFNKDEPTYKTVSDQWGTVRTVMVPETSLGGIKYLACVDYDIGYVDKILQRNFLRSIATVIFFLFLSVPIILIYSKQHRQYTVSIRESEEKYRKLVSRISDVIVIMDVNGIIQYKSPNITEQFGWEPEDLIGKHGLSTVHNDDKERIGRELDTLIRKTGKRVRVQYNYLCKDGSTKPIELTAVNLLDDPDIKGVLANYKDISERKKSEEELKQSEEKYRTMIERSNDMIWALDTSGNFTFFNKQTEDVTGLRLNEWVGKSFAPLILEEELPVIMEIFQNGLKGKPAHYDLRFKKQTDDILTISVNTAPLWMNGKVNGIVSFGRDITDQKLAEEERARLVAQLQQAQKMEAIGTLAGGIAHDFNNILSAIIGYNELLKMNLPKNSPEIDYTNQIHKAGTRAKDLVQQILTFSRQTDQEVKPVEISMIVKEVIKLLRSSLPATIEIKQKIQSDYLVMGDPTQIHQILMNLCTNAGHAMQEKGGLLTIDLMNTDLKEDQINDKLNLIPGIYVQLNVSDTGHGIPTKHLDRVFDPFFTTKERGEGTGMGLSVVHGIVESHKGAIHVSSEEGNGSTFKIFLPAIERHFEPDKHEEGGVQTGTEHILLVDDESIIVEMNTSQLEALGYKVTSRSNGTEALALFKNKPDSFDLVITDMTMPLMTGDKLAKEIKCIRPNIPIILCTGFSSKITSESAPQLGIDAFLMKPIVLHDLAKVIRNVLEGK